MIHLRRLTLLATLAGVVLAGCGLKGEPETPPAKNEENARAAAVRR